MNIVKYKNIFFAVSGALFIVSVVLFVTIGLKPGIDFTGGSLVEVSFVDERPSIKEIQESLSSLGLGEIQVQPAGEEGMILRTRFITEEEHQNILEALRVSFPKKDDSSVSEKEIDGVSIDSKDAGAVEVTIGQDGTLILGGDSKSLFSVREERIETVGPSISSNLRERTWKIGLLVIIAIILYVAYAFRKVSKQVSSWKFGVTAVIALIHDVMITIGVFVLLGHYLGVEVNIPFVVALLTILGYSVNDTIVVFDRIRENLIKIGYSKFELVVNKGVSDTILRSINTCFTTLLVLVALFFFGGDTIKYFALALIVGISFGTYSSIFLASPILFVWERIGRR